MLRRLKSFLDCFDESNLFSDIFLSALESKSKIKVPILLNRFIIGTSYLGQKWRTENDFRRLGRYFGMILVRIKRTRTFGTYSLVRYFRSVD